MKKSKVSQTSVVDEEVQYSRVSVEIGVTVNMGNYESVRVSITEDAVIPEGTSINKVRSSVIRNIESALIEQIKFYKCNGRAHFKLDASDFLK